MQIVEEVFLLAFQQLSRDETCSLASLCVDDDELGRNVPGLPPGTRPLP